MFVKPTMIKHYRKTFSSHNLIIYKVTELRFCQSWRPSKPMMI